MSTIKSGCEQDQPLIGTDPIVAQKSYNIRMLSARLDGGGTTITDHAQVRTCPSAHRLLRRISGGETLLGTKMQNARSGNPSLEKED